MGYDRACEMKQETVDRVLLGERSEIGAWRSVWTATPGKAREALGLSHAAGPDGALALHADRFGWWFFNRVLGLGLDGPPDLDWLAVQCERYRSAAQPFGVSIRDAQVAGLAPWLGAQQLNHSSTLAKMIRTVDRLPVPTGDLRIRQVGVEEADLFAETAGRGYGMPASLHGMFAALPAADGWRCYLGFAAGEPVATGALHLQNGTAWIGFGSVVPEHRHRGVHGRMLLHRMHRAADLGCRWLVTETNRPEPDEVGASFRNMQQLGFEMAYTRPNFVSGT